MRTFVPLSTFFKCMFHFQLFLDHVQLFLENHNESFSFSKLNKNFVSISIAFQFLLSAAQQAAFFFRPSHVFKQSEFHSK